MVECTVGPRRPVVVAVTEVDDADLLVPDV
ncbi:hypothetical protein ABIE67_005853 [Streptomyces sp. V4I8]